MPSHFIANICYVRDSSTLHKKSDLKDPSQICKHLHGFKAEFVQFNAILSLFLEDESVLDVSFLSEKKHVDKLFRSKGCLLIRAVLIPRKNRN